MKKPINKHVYVFSIVLFLFSCNSKETLTDREKYGLKGNVQFIHEINEDGEKLIEFNQDGICKNKMETVAPLNKTFALTETKYNYNSDNNIQSEIEDVYSIDNRQNSHSELNYNYKNNKIFSVTYSGKKDKSYKYENGLKSQEITNNKCGVLTSVYISNFKYNENKDLISVIEYATTEVDGSTNKCESKFEKIFNDNKIISDSYFQKKNNTYILSFSHVFTYDSLGNLIKRKTENDKGEFENTTYIHEYDKNGNWIKETGYGGRIIKRQIFYFGDNSDDIFAKFVTLKNQLKSGCQVVENQKVSMPSVENNSSNITNQKQQKQWVNCSYCNGKGIKICTYCTGRGTARCDRCNGRTYLYKTSGGGTETCYECGGRGEKSCSHCNGHGNNGTCSTCNGKGQVQE